LGLNSAFFLSDSIFSIPTFTDEEARIQRLEERRQTFIKFLLCGRLTVVFLGNAIQSSQVHLRDINLKCIFYRCGLGGLERVRPHSFVGKARA